MIVQITDDLDLKKIAESGQCFRWEMTGPGTFRIIAGKECLYISELGEGRYELSCPEEEYGSFWRNYFDLDEDYRGIRGRIDPEEDPFLWQAAEQEKGIRILRQDPFEMLITFIISQNRNIPSIRRSAELLAKACGEQRTDCRGIPYYAFPEPPQLAALSEETLLSCRLGYRWKYVQAAAQAVFRGDIEPERLARTDEDAAIKELTGLYGVGIKVASCVALFGLHHLNAFPIDVWMKRILEEQYPEGYPYEKYTPYNGVYQQYMFAYYRLISS
ncbi:MAG: hypothetical protein K6E30_08385 [Lachnospiraceae bacterium]|nr:hypothetical protein [Lachnospiraceae bacterium]